MKPENTEHQTIENDRLRCHINLSQNAWDVIQIDSYSFMKNPTKDGFINRIIENYFDDSYANIRSFYEMKKVKYETIMEQMSNDSTGLEYIENYIVSLIENDINELKNRFEAYPKGHQHKLRVNISNYQERISKEELWDYQQFYCSPGVFIKYLMEEYASLPYVKREAIFFKSVIDSLNAYIHSTQGAKKILEINYRNGNDTQKYYIKPYQIVEDPSLGYNYLIAASSDDHKNYMPETFRISRIVSEPKERSFSSGKITQKELSELKRKLEESSAPFIASEGKEIHVVLSPNGQYLYDTILNLRPNYTSKASLNDGYKEYTFHCSIFQARSYFFRFGKDAIVTEPLELFEAMKEAHSDAAEQYLAYQKLSGINKASKK